MTDRASAEAFLLTEVEGLEPFDFVAVIPSGRPARMVEVTRSGPGGLEVRVPGRPPIMAELPVAVRSKLRERGFSCTDPADRREPWTAEAPDASGAVRTVTSLLTDVFGEKPDAKLDIAHGSHRAEHEAREKLAAVRGRLERVLAQMLEHAPEQDADGDYVLPLGDVHVIVAPRATPAAAVVVRVFAVTNVGVNVVPELGLLLARLNFGLAFGRFALDAEHRSIWVDETLLGEHFSDEELRFTVEVVAKTADDWDDRLKQMFGGATYEEVLTTQVQPLPPRKPGEGGYL